MPSPAFLCKIIGPVNVTLPAITQSLSIPLVLYLWPASVYGEDLRLPAPDRRFYSRSAWTFKRRAGWHLSAGDFHSGGGVAMSGIYMVGFRALQGIIIAMHLPFPLLLSQPEFPKEGKKLWLRLLDIELDYGLLCWVGSKWCLG